MTDTQELDVITNEDITVEVPTLDPTEEAQRQADLIKEKIVKRDEKLNAAREHLIANISVTSDKYLTANGLMIALDIVRDVVKDSSLPLEKELELARAAARNVSDIAEELEQKARNLDINEFGNFCEDVYECDFVLIENTYGELIEELLILQLCQNIGPAAQDIADFKTAADEDIEESKQQLNEYCIENDIAVPALD